MMTAPADPPVRCRIEVVPAFGRRGALARPVTPWHSLLVGVRPQVPAAGRNRKLAGHGRAAAHRAADPPRPPGAIAAVMAPNRFRSRQPTGSCAFRLTGNADGR